MARACKAASDKWRAYRFDFAASFDSPVGRLFAASDGERLEGLWIQGQKRFPAALESGAANDRPDLPVFISLRFWLDSYFSGRNPSASAIPLRLQGSDFQQIVWNFLLRVPYGKVLSYGELAAQTARRLGKPRFSARAVGGAVARNPISIIVPCHRIVASDGKLTGYAGGLKNKIRLLELEGVPVSNDRVPMNCFHHLENK